jgi:hypothetical protein
VERLRETPGYGEFDARRRAKCDKQIGGGVLRGGLDEGADFLEWEHYRA